MNFSNNDYLQPYLALRSNFANVTDMTAIDNAHEFSISPETFARSCAVFVCDLRRVAPNLLGLRQVTMTADGLTVVFFCRFRFKST